MSREKTELDAMRMQRDDLLMLLRRLIYVVSKKNEAATADLIKRANDYMDRKCPPPRIIRAMDDGSSAVAAGLEPQCDHEWLEGYYGLTCVKCKYQCIYGCEPWAHLVDSGPTFDEEYDDE